MIPPSDCQHLHFALSQFCHCLYSGTEESHLTIYSFLIKVIRIILSALSILHTNWLNIEMPTWSMNYTLFYNIVQIWLMNISVHIKWSVSSEFHRLSSGHKYNSIWQCGSEHFWNPITWICAITTPSIRYIVISLKSSFDFILKSDNIMIKCLLPRCKIFSGPFKITCRC